MTDEFDTFCSDAKTDLALLLRDGGQAVIKTASSKDATWHPNGFVVFEFGRVPSGNVRLHLWPSGNRHLRDTTEHVHSHAWDLYSVVLAGTYVEEMFEIAEETVADARAYSAAWIEYARDRNTLHPVAREYLRQSEVVIARTGEAHTVRAGEAHRTVIPEHDFVATLLVTSPLRFEGATVYAVGPLPEPAHRREAVSADTRAQLLDRLLNARRGQTR